MKRFFVFTQILLASLSFVIVNSSNAASITSLSVSTGVDYGSGAYATKYYFDAHTHLQVTTVQAPHKEDHWEADTGVQKFTVDDNP